MKSSEASELGQLTGRSLRRATEFVRDTHVAISDGVHGALRAAIGPVATPVRLAQDAVAHTAYALTGLGVSVGAQVIGAVAGARLRERDAERASVHDGGTRHAIAIGLGIAGDTVARQAASLAPVMHVRHAGQPVELTSAGLLAAYGPVGPQVAVLLHGLFESEAAWRLAADKRTPYPQRLRADLGLDCVSLRYNTGLRVSENGRALGILLSDLVAAWPVPLTRIVLIGHSMGGLVIHSALAQVEDGPDAAWPALVTDTVTLGSPHHGSPIARGVDRTAWRLDADERQRGRALAEVLRWRSAGVRDMAHGNVVTADWQGYPLGDPADHRTHPLPWSAARHRAVVGVTAGRLPGSLRDLVGDVIVPVPSAAHAGQVRIAGKAGNSSIAGHASVTRRFADEDVAAVAGVTHLGLLNHDEVYAHLRGWLAAEGHIGPAH